MQKFYFTLIAFCGLQLLTSGQTPASQREKIAVLNIDSKGLTLDPEQVGNLVRLELTKLDKFEVFDKYDVDYLAKQNNFTTENCYGKACLIETGKKLRADKMLGGAVQLIGDKITVNFKLIDVGKESEEKSVVMDFLDVRQQIQSMISIALKKMFDLPVDENLLNQLTKVQSFETSVNTPEQTRLNLSGPRMGVLLFTGDNARRMKAPASEGGLDGYPTMFQFGYQFETAYLNQGGLQALFEFIPLISGLDQGLVIPSITVLHGLRSNVSGFEFAFGPTFNVTRQDEGFFDSAGKWVRLSDWKRENSGYTTLPETMMRFDNRGLWTLSSNFVFAFGKSFRSGKLNIPVNFFFVPSKAGSRFGLSVGFNARG